MNVLIRFAALLVIASLMGACAPKIKKDYEKFRAENPRSILIVPVINNTVNVDAPRYFLSAISVPVAERGYYSFPVNLVRAVMNEEGLSDANMVHNAEPTVLGALVGADAILYITIEKWETTYIIISATTTVSFSYVLKSGRTGDELWRESATIQYSPQASGGGGIGALVVMAVAAAIQKAAPDYMPLARRANHQSIWLPGKGLPAGPYHENYGQDHAEFSSGTGIPKGESSKEKISEGTVRQN